MAEGEIKFSATHTPAHWDDKMDSVTLMCSVQQPGGRGSVMVTKEVSPEAARYHAAQIIKACEIVEGEQNVKRPGG